MSLHVRQVAPRSRLPRESRAIAMAILGLMMIAFPDWVSAQGNGVPQQGPGGQRQMPRLVLQALDLNHDGILDADEIAAAPKSLLTLDKNEDGQLTSDEWSPPPETAGASTDDLVQMYMSFDKAKKGYLVKADLPERMQSIFDRADANHDGKLTPEELRALARRQRAPQGPQQAGANPGNATQMDPILSALDLNHDGTIEADEIAAAAKSLLTLDKNGDGKITADEMQMRQPDPREMVQRILNEADKDKDGRISRDEAPDNLKEQFDTIDKNHDGYIDKDELTQLMSQRRGPGGPGGPQQGDRPQSGPNGPNGNPEEQHR